MVMECYEYGRVTEVIRKWDVLNGSMIEGRAASIVSVFHKHACK